MPLPTLVRWNQPYFGQKRLQDIKAEEFKRFTDDKRLLMANDMIDVVSKQKYLGMMFDSQLNWSHHVASVCKSMSYYLVLIG